MSLLGTRASSSPGARERRISIKCLATALQVSALYHFHATRFHCILIYPKTPSQRAINDHHYRRTRYSIFVGVYQSYAWIDLDKKE